MGKRVVFFLGLAVLQGVVFILLNERIAPVVVGYLSKNGPGYVVAWRDEMNQLRYASYGSLETALDFATRSLSLRRGRVVREDTNIEHIWLEDRRGVYTVFWKTERLPYLHQMTFQTLPEANFFLKAFQSGSYTPSPVGHSVLLLPQKGS